MITTSWVTVGLAIIGTVGIDGIVSVGPVRRECEARWKSYYVVSGDVTERDVGRVTGKSVGRVTEGFVSGCQAISKTNLRRPLPDPIVSPLTVTYT